MPSKQATGICLAEGEKYYDDTDNQNGTANVEEQSAVPSTSSVGPHSEIDAKLADFFSVRNSLHGIYGAHSSSIFSYLLATFFKW